MRIRKAWRGVLVVCLLAGTLVMLQTPLFQSYPRLITIPEGASLQEVAALLATEEVVVSPISLRFFVTLMGGGNDVKAGEYEFEKPEGALRIAWRLVNGEYNVEPVKVFIPEGTSVREMAVLFEKNLLSFDTEDFISRALDREGFLFPDTYFFPPNAGTDTIIRTLSNHFEEKIEPLEEAIDASGHTLEEIVIMASILEKEARTPEDRRVIAGILWDRIDIGMPLQVDAPFVYVIGKGSADLSIADLATSSPYNTYKNLGLPVGPITNPGLDAIEAALNPTKTDYLFYLSDDAGTMHYAVTFEEHKRNKERYLW